MNLNKAMIIGNVTRDPEVRQTGNGTSVASFSVATNFFWNDAMGQRQDRVEFHNIVAWRKLADICGQYLRKGSKVYVEGRLQTRDWVDKNTGQKRFITEIIAENMIMLDRPANGAPRQDNNYAQDSKDNEAVIDINNDGPAPQYSDDGGFAPSDNEIKVENIPF
ncbi:MAG: single-stranded DNA-binding protein [Patescibacteria group bacterium]|nr:MAG: single-stranded DNA-binding protein [Patescibacteria group bacterium]